MAALPLQHTPVLRIAASHTSKGKLSELALCVEDKLLSDMNDGAAAVG